MKSITNIKLETVQDVYNGPEGDLWELVMGQQIHIGGLASSMALAEKAAIQPGTNGVDLCSCNGAGMRFLVRFRNVASMVGIDATEEVIRRCGEYCKSENLSDKVTCNIADACATGLPDAEADFVWGEDAWCYVVDKPKLIAEAARLVKLGGTIAFTDWVEGPMGLTDDEAKRFMSFMKFPNIESIEGYAELLRSNGCEIVVAEDTEQFASHCALYIDMLTKQLTYDALKIIGFDMEMMQAMGGEMAFMLDLAKAGKIAQGRFVATKI